MKRALVTLSLLALAAPLASCASNADAEDGTLAVTSNANACTVSADKAPSGKVVFTVFNKGSEVTEFYLLAADGLRIIGEVENIAPGLTRDLVVQVDPGKYFTACKPGMVGNGIRAAFRVTDSGKSAELSGDDKALVDKATAQYASYVKNETEELLTGTKEFARRVKAGDDAGARPIYASTRIHWERIEPVAESFGDLDPKMDLREADLEKGQKWTGWHPLEKDLWPPKGYPPLSAKERATLADGLVADTQTLYDRTRTKTYTATDIANGAKSLLDEVATGKVTGEEEAWSHTDLTDFQGNIDGAKVAFEDLRPLVHKKDPSLESTIATKFIAVQKLLDTHKAGGAFVSYNTLTKSQVKQLSDAVNGLSEPLSKLTGVVTLS